VLAQELPPRGGGLVAARQRWVLECQQLSIVARLLEAAARLIIDRCAELGSLIDFYDDAVDQVLRHDDEAPF